MWKKCYPHQCHFIPSSFRLVLRGGLGQHQTERQREVEEKKEGENTLLCKSCASDVINNKPNLPLPDPSVPALEENEKIQEKQKDHVTDYYPPSPMYVVSYEGDASTLVNNLIPEATPKEKKDRNKTEESKTTEDRRDLIEITCKEDDLDLDWDSDYSY